MGKRLLSVTHLGNFVYGDSKPQIPRLFASRSLHGTEGAFAELIVHDKDKFIQLIRRYVGGYIAQNSEIVHSVTHNPPFKMHHLSSVVLRDLNALVALYLLNI